MKKTTSIFAILVLFSAMIFSSCEEDTEPETLEEVESELVEKRTEMQVLKKEISDLEQRLNELDTGYVETKPVRIDTLSPSTFFTTVVVQGVAESRQNVTLSSKTSGLVVDIRVREGQSVKKGQILVSLDSDIIASNIEEVKTSLQLARTNYEKLKNLRKQNIGSEMQYLEAENRVNVLNQKLETLRRQLAQTKITAPFSGIIDNIFVKEGEAIMTTAPVVRLVDLTEMKINADVSESYVGIINQGDSVDVTFPSLSGISKRGKVTAVGQVINPNNRTFNLEIEIKNANRFIKPNMLASIVVTRTSIDSALVVPTKLIQQDRMGKEYVFVIGKESNRAIAQKKYVITGDREKGNTRIVSGLEPGDLIITDGSREVSDGTHIRIKNNR